MRLLPAKLPDPCQPCPRRWDVIAHRNSGTITRVVTSPIVRSKSSIPFTSPLIVIVSGALIVCVVLPCGAMDGGYAGVCNGNALMPTMSPVA